MVVPISRWSWQESWSSLTRSSHLKNPTLTCEGWFIIVPEVLTLAFHLTLHTAKHMSPVGHQTMTLILAPIVHAPKQVSAALPSSAVSTPALISPLVLMPTSAIPNLNFVIHPSVNNCCKCDVYPYNYQTCVNITFGYLGHHVILLTTQEVVKLLDWLRNWYMKFEKQEYGKSWMAGSSHSFICSGLYWRKVMVSYCLYVCFIFLVYHFYITCNLTI